MKIITRYIVKEFVKPLLLSSVTFGGLVLISEFFRELSTYLEKKTPFSAVFAYLFLNLPWWIVQVLPVAVLLAVLFSLGQLARRGEITALKAAGVNLWRIIGVLFFCGLAIGVTEIALREFVIPVTVRKADAIRREKLQSDTAITKTDFYNLVVSLPDNGRMTIGYLNAKQNVAAKIVIDYYDDQFNLKRQVVAEKAEWHQSGWIFFNGAERHFKGGQWDESYFAQRQETLPFRPQDFVVIAVRPEQMTTPEYRRYLEQLKMLSVPSEKEQIQFQLRWSSAFSHVIVMLIGIPFALGLGSKHGKMISFTFALIFAFIYWGVQAIGQSLGENKVVSPLLAAWIGNIVFGIAGLFAIGKIQK